MNTEAKAGALSANDKQRVVECVAKFENAVFGNTKFLITEQLADDTPIRFLHFNENGTIIGQGEAVVPRSGLKQIRVAYLNTFSHQIYMFLERNLEFMPKGCYDFYATICGPDKFEDVYSALKTYEQFRTEAWVVPPQIEQKQVVEHLPGDWNPQDLVDHDSVAAVIRKDNKWVFTMWHNKCQMTAIPGGKVDPGETPEEAIARECYEEVGIVVNAVKKLGEIEKDYDRGGKTVHVKTHVFEVVNYTGNLTNCEPKKHDLLQFVSIDRLRHERDVHGTKMMDALDWFLNSETKIA